MRTNHLARAARILGRAAGTIAIIIAAASCAPHDFNSSDTGSEGQASADNGPHAATRAEQNAGAPVQGVATFTAADVARILLVLEQSSIAQAQIAQERALTMEVKTYASMMIRERSAAMERLQGILDRTTPRSEDPTPPLFERELSRSHEWLRSQETGFDLAFMTAETGAHARIIGLIEASLLPSATQVTSRASADTAARELEEELTALRTQTSAQIVYALRVQGVLRAGNAPIDQSTTAGGATVGEGPAAGPKVPQ